MMEIKTIGEAKNSIMGRVKFGKTENLPENLKDSFVLEGIITEITSTWKHSNSGDICVGFVCSVDVIDPLDGGLHHFTTNRIFSIDERDVDIKNIAITDEIAKIDLRKTELELSYISNNLGEAT